MALTWMQNFMEGQSGMAPRTAAGEQAVERYYQKAAPHNTAVDALAGLGGGSGSDVRWQQAQRMGAMADSGQAATGAYGQPGAGGGASMYTQQGYGLGGAYDVHLRDPGTYNDPNYLANRAAIQARAGAIGGMPTQNMDIYSSAPAFIDPTAQAQFRQRQMDLGQALWDQSMGNGPSVAGSQLQQSTEMNLQAALAQAASGRGGNLGAMQYQLGANRANIQQQAAQGLAQARIQEQMAARAQLGDVLNAGRGADIGLAAQTAQLGQQNNQFNAGLAQQAAGMNLQMGVQQEQFKQQKLNELMLAGLGYDQARAQADLQARQFGADLFNRSQLGVSGLNMQGGQQAMQLMGGIMQGGGSLMGSFAGMAGGAGGGAAQAAYGANGGGNVAQGAMGPMTIQLPK